MQNIQDYGFRLYNPSIAKFLSVDPLAPSYPWYTPYQFAGNKPIVAIDLDGLEEYFSYTAYTLHKEDAALSASALDGTNGVWFESDRYNKTDRWKNAMMYITENNKPSLLDRRFKLGYGGFITTVYEESGSFGMIRDYYHWAQSEMNSRGYESRWAKGASYLVDELQVHMYQGSLSSTFYPELRRLLKELNIGIAEYAVGKFKGVLYQGGGERVNDWYEWDRQFIEEEQVTVAAPSIYSAWDGTKALSDMNAMSRKEGLIGNISSLLSKHFFPDFSLWGVDVTDSESGYGAEGRYNIPLYMLYPVRHASESGTPLNEDQYNDIMKAHDQINEYHDNETKEK